jgi:hypothetical protein
LGLVAALLSGFHVSGFWSALAAWFMVALTQAVGSVLLKSKKSDS